MAFCLHPETGLVNKLVNFFERKRAKFNLVFNNNLEYGRWKLGVKVVKDLSLFRKMTEKNVNINTYEISNGAIQQECVMKVYSRGLGWRYRFGNLLKPESE